MLIAIIPDQMTAREMGQHFLLRASSRTLSLKQIFRMTDAEARELFQTLRWKDNDGQPVCPRCDNTEKHYQMKTRNLWKCAERAKQFRDTSGTVFAYHKLPLQDCLTAIAIFTNGAKGVSALQISRDLNVQYKTAFVMLHKVRESVRNSCDW